MPHSYSALWVHLVWSTKNREHILTPLLKHEVYAVINNIVNDHEIYLDCINGVEDHVHLLVRLRTDQSVADIVKTIKGNSWDYFKDDPEKYVSWQDGFAAFSVSPSHLKRVRSYIYNQEKHHRDKSFGDELKEIKQSTKLHG
ncbi:IS200/IS605 family transposase [Mucilaginibacter sp. BJC16-A38]|uniref:IS200/IS605 family transposase n=1 Tax=Mucilaginibacter phenanthrenivorans TaxID=1234842 RepID=UPI0021584981|nr:IS200/IS605 family transposase [Mucilaginibacter phenanthrenivorans]MCR8557417.1 IS200/IS605 family transposase [Mucilaginibacter phenanthrenivorans]